MNDIKTFEVNQPGMVESATLIASGKDGSQEDYDRLRQEQLEKTFKILNELTGRDKFILAAIKDNKVSFVYAGVSYNDQAEVIQHMVRNFTAMKEAQGQNK